MRRNRQTFFSVFVIGLCVLMLGCGRGSEKEKVELQMADIQEQEETKEKETEPEVVSEEENQKEIYIYVCGQVRNPGVYKLIQGDRITHALLAAGGLTDEAAAEYLNQAELLIDGQKIYVPTEEEAASLPLSESSVMEEEKNDGKININTAGKEELMQLSGVGESRALAIISYREANGDFKSIEEIQEIDGIKAGIFNRIKEQIKVE